MYLIDLLVGENGWGGEAGDAGSVAGGEWSDEAGDGTGTVGAEGGWGGEGVVAGGEGVEASGDWGGEGVVAGGEGVEAGGDWGGEDGLVGAAGDEGLDGFLDWLDFLGDLAEWGDDLFEGNKQKVNIWKFGSKIWN